MLPWRISDQDADGQAGVLLVSFVKDGETLHENRTDRLLLLLLLCLFIFFPAKMYPVHPLSCVCPEFAYNAPPGVSHKVAAREQAALQKDPNSICMWDRITWSACDWSVLWQTSNNNTRAKSIQNNKQGPSNLDVEKSGGPPSRRGASSILRSERISSGFGLGGWVWNEREQTFRFYSF